LDLNGMMLPVFIGRMYLYLMIFLDLDGRWLELGKCPDLTTCFYGQNVSISDDIWSWTIGG
jgi:hypothetical protein